MFNVTTINTANLEKQIPGKAGVFGVEMRLPVGIHAPLAHATPAMAMKFGALAAFTFGSFDFVSTAK